MLVRNTLADMGLPLVHAVGGLSDAGLAPAEDRRGQSVRAWVRSLDGIQKEGVSLSGRTGRAWRFASDEGAHLGGHDSAPNPLSYVAIGMAASLMTELLSLAKSRGISLTEPVVILENFYFRDGSFPAGTMVSGALSPEVSLSCRGGSDPAALRALLVDAVAAAPVGGLVRDEKISRFTLTHNGIRLDPTEVAELPGDALPDPGDPIARVSRMVAETPAYPLARKTETEEEMARRIADAPPRAPKLDGTKKLLHLRTTCRLRPDGTYDCLREQFAQSSSTWSFVIDDRPGAAGTLAPDALGAFAIGVAFCFMTQVGRYAHMAKLPLDGYRVVQDMHFTLGGVSGATGRVGTADPVETHVFMDSRADDSTVQRVLGVAERTCFLHALCRERAKIRVREVTVAA